MKKAKKHHPLKGRRRSQTKKQLANLIFCWLLLLASPSPRFPANSFKPNQYTLLLLLMFGKMTNIFMSWELHTTHIPLAGARRCCFSQLLGCDSLHLCSSHSTTTIQMERKTLLLFYFLHSHLYYDEKYSFPFAHVTSYDKV